MPYEKISDGEHIAYSITGALLIWVMRLKDIFEVVTETVFDGSDPRAKYFLDIAALSMGTLAKIKWTSQWHSESKARQIDSLLAQLRDNAINCFDVIDYLANNMPVRELEKMKDRIVSDVTAYFPAKQEEHEQLPTEFVPFATSQAWWGGSISFGKRGIQEEHEPEVLKSESVDYSDPSDILSRLSIHIEHRYTYPYDRFPTMSQLEYHNLVFLGVERSSNTAVTFRMLPGILSTSKSKANQVYSSVFLSHNVNDKRFARRLARDLQRSNIKVWIDEAEIKIGDSLLSKIQSGIQEMEYLGVILSFHSVNSEWVTRELHAAMQLEINQRRVKVLPILYQRVELPVFLLDKKYVDFSVPNNYKVSLDSLVNTLLGCPPSVLFTAKQAAQVIKTAYSPLGSLCGISQQGICQQYIPQQIQIRGDWYYADSKTGRSTVWVCEYYDKANKGYSSYGVTDGITQELSTGVLENGVKPLDFNFIDSDMAILSAIETANSLKAIPADENAYFVNAMLKFCLPLDDYLWFVLFFDITLSKVTFIVEVNPHTGDTARVYRR